MSNHFLLPIRYSEFIKWYNRREGKYSAIELIPVDVEGKKVNINSEWREVLKNIIPDYEEDFEVVISLVEIDTKSLPGSRDDSVKKHCFIGEKEDRREGPRFEKIDILDLERLYPLTERGARMLEVRLPSNVEIGPPLFEEEIREEEKNLMEQQAKMGGKALLEIFDLEINEGQIEILQDDILDAVYKKVTRQEEAPPNSLLKAVIRYDRQDQPTFPSTPIGSCYDYLEVLKRHLRRRYKEGEISEQTGMQMREVFQEASSTLREMGQYEKPYVAIQDEQFSESLDKLEELTSLDFDRFPPESAVLFLDLRNQLREDDDLEETSVYVWNDILRENGKERALAIGLWMIGAFFDFSTFADIYYEFNDAGFLSDAKSSKA